MGIKRSTRRDLEKSIAEMRMAMSTKLRKKERIDNEMMAEFVAKELTLRLDDDGKLEEVLDVEDTNEMDINDIFSPQKELAIKIFNALDDNDIVIAFAPMQFGKTGTLYYLVNGLLRALLKPGENVVFMTAMSDTALLIQNKSNLQDKDFAWKNGKKVKSKIIVTRMNPDFKEKAEQIIKDFKVKYLIFDECDYGTGKKSLFNKSFFSRLKKNNFDVKLILMSATPYCALNAVMTGELDAAVVEANPSSNYFGVGKMLELGMVRDVRNIDNATGNNEKIPYRLIRREDASFSLTNEFQTDLEWFLTQEGGGLAIVRAKNTTEAHFVRDICNGLYKGKIESIAIGTHSDSIKETLGNNSLALRNKIVYNGDKILLVVVNALAAGKDLGDLKEYTRLIVENRKSAIANGSQGLVGRLCGYHENRNIRIIASIDVLENYVQLQMNWKLIGEPSFIDKTNELRLNLSTQLKKGKKTEERYVYKEKVYDVFTKKDVELEAPRLRDLFPDNNHEFGTWDELVNLINNPNLRTKRNSAINTQRRSRYHEKYMDLFDSILAECKNGTIKFANRFHRFRRN